MSQIDDIFNVMVQHDRKWMIDGRKTEPTFDDVQRVFNKMKEDLDTLEGSVSIQCGGIMLVRDQEHIGVFVYLGDLDEDSSN